jgi:hypothetical protein
MKALIKMVKNLWGKFWDEEIVTLIFIQNKIRMKAIFNKHKGALSAQVQQIISAELRIHPLLLTTQTKKMNYCQIFLIHDSIRYMSCE